MFKNMKIGLRMGLGFAVLLALMVALIVVSLNHMEVTHEMLNHIVKVNNVRISLANNMIDDARETAIAVRSILLAKYKNQTNESIQKLRDEITEHRRSFSDGLSKLKELIAMDDIKGLDLFSKIVVSGDAARQLQDQVIELAAAGKPGDGIDLMTAKAYPTMKQWIKGLDDLIDHNKERTAMRYDEAEKAEAAARTSMFTLGALSIVLAVVIGVFLTLSIVRPLRSMSEIAATISEGDLSIKIGYISTDEMGELAKSFDKMIGYLKEISGVADNIASNNLSIKFKPVSEKDVLGNAFVVMVDNLRAMIKDIQEGVNTLASSSNQILALTTQLAASSNETATAVTETTTTMEEVRQTSRQMSQRAAVVSEAAQSTAQTSEAGRRSVEDAIAGMGRIKEQMDVIANNIVKLSEQSQTIGAIISTVNDLANQSNLLAVNASIEAAKAGEQGKGFAVVAQEVRSLAEQSKDATNQVRTILNDIQKAISGAVMATEQGAKAVEAGLKQSQTAGDFISKIAEDIVKAAQAAMQISASTNEQTAGIDQVSSAMENIKKATEQIVSSTRQSEESTKNLHELGMKLKQMVERYKA